MKVTILALHNTTGTSVMGPMDVFFHAGKLWNHIHGLTPTPYFEVEIAGIDGDAVKSCAKTLIHDMNRESQAPYAAFRFQRKHKDEKIKIAQQWIENNYTEVFDVYQLAKHSCMSRRTFERRFKNATGDTPLAYLQRMRVEIAKRFLESGTLSFDEICYRVGYENSNFFREVFKKFTHLLPSDYQKKFQGYRLRKD